MTVYLRAPQINANEEEAKLLAWTVPPGTAVQAGQTVAVLETLKATMDLESEATGFLRPLVEAGTMVRVGAVIAAFTATPDELVNVPDAGVAGVSATTIERKVTRKALLAARALGLEEEVLRREVPGDGPVTEAEVEVLARTLRRKTPPHVDPAYADAMDDAYPAGRQERVLLIAGGLGAVQVLDVLARISSQRAVAIVDDNPDTHGRRVLGVPIVGGLDCIPALRAEGVFDTALVTASTSNVFRKKVQRELEASGVRFTNVIDPSARVGLNAKVGTGNVILPFCHIGACAIIGDGNFLSPYVDLEHHNVVGNFCTFGPGVMASGRVFIGDNVKFGTGVFIEPRLDVGAGSIVASGVVLVRSVPPHSVVRLRQAYSVSPIAPISVED
jgi:sugar O-acyltransferase (sialic acid O-acetyltransferase NeuD family)